MTEAIGKPELEVIGDVYRFRWTCGIEAELERFSEHHDELSAELTIRSTRPPAPGLLHSARFNLMSSQAQRTVATALAERDSDLDWRAIVEQLRFIGRETYRRGEPAIDMRTYVPSGRPRWRVEPYVEHGGISVTFGDGESGKTMMAMGASATSATGVSVFGRLHGEPGPGMYLDYETDSDTFDERLRAICAGAGIRERPAIFYRRMTASLREAAPTIRRQIAELGITMVVVDSAGPACGGDSLASDVVIALFNTARSFGVPVLFTDHISKNGADQDKAFGSVYKHNAPRLTWRVDKKQNEGEDSLVVALVNTKRNNGRKLPRRAYRIDCQTIVDERGDERLVSVRFGSADLARDFPERASLAQRILAELGQTGAVPPAELAEGLGADPTQVRARLKDLVDNGKVVRLADRRVALAARGAP